MAYNRIMQVRILGRIHGQQTVNVLNFGTNEAPADDSALATLLGELALAVIECFISQLVGATTSDWTLVSAEAKQIFPTESDAQVSSAPAATVGTRGATSVSFASTLMNIRTGGGGRRGRGRIFLPPPGEADITTSAIDSEDVNDFLAGFITCLVGKFVGPSKTTDFQLGVLSRKAVSEGTAINAAFRDAIGLEVNSEMSVLRSRKVGSGS